MFHRLDPRHGGDHSRDVRVRFGVVGAQRGNQVIATMVVAGQHWSTGGIRVGKGEVRRGGPGWVGDHADLRSGVPSCGQRVD